MERLYAEQISFSYGENKILEEISAQIHKGQFTAITGPNGSGKTTLLKNLLNLLHPDEGAVFLDRKNISTISRREFARNAGVVPQNPQMDFDYTVEETVLMGRYPHLSRFQRLSSADYAIAGQAMEQTDILDLKDHPVSRISGGETQRVAIARALTQEPRILALDEPTNHLDIKHQVAILSLLKKLCSEKGIAVVSILHDLNFAMAYADQVLLLQKGSVFHSGPPAEVLTAETIQRVYGIESALQNDPFTGASRIIYRIAPGE